jgi:hypothetical protein
VCLLGAALEPFNQPTTGGARRRRGRIDGRHRHDQAPRRQVLNRELDQPAFGDVPFAVQAPNAFCLAEIKIPKTYDKPEFMDARRKNLPETLASVAADIPVERYCGFPIDAKFLYERNLGDLHSLAGRKIALIGCGTIGGFLAAYLAQSGAGTLGGLLALFDREILMPSNLGRHLLGMPYLNRNKAVACADYIRSQFPHVEAEGHSGDALAKLAMLSGTTS